MTICATCVAAVHAILWSDLLEAYSQVTAKTVANTANSSNACESESQLWCSSDLVCIDTSLLCNGRPDCSNGQDETNCLGLTKPSESTDAPGTAPPHTTESLDYQIVVITVVLIVLVVVGYALARIAAQRCWLAEMRNVRGAEVTNIQARRHALDRNSHAPQQSGVHSTAAPETVIITSQIWVSDNSSQVQVRDEPPSYTSAFSNGAASVSGSVIALDVPPDYESVCLQLAKSTDS